MSTRVDYSRLNGLIWQDSLPRTGPQNMAMDEWLLERALHDQTVHLRFYRWTEPTLSVGYFQEKAGLILPETLQGKPVVRRLTGGGAILHDHELTYSLVLPATHAQTSQPTGLYRLVHQAVIQALSMQGIQARFRGTEATEKNSAFLCFLRGDRHDLLLGEHKVLGSAQRRRKGAVLQHGSLVLKRSAYAPEVEGLLELSGRQLDEESFCQELTNLLLPLAANWDTRKTEQVFEQDLLQKLLQKYESNT